jgi:hypothetical protein
MLLVVQLRVNAKVLSAHYILNGILIRGTLTKLWPNKIILSLRQNIEILKAYCVCTQLLF